MSRTVPDLGSKHAANLGPAGSRERRESLERSGVLARVRRARYGRDSEQAQNFFIPGFVACEISHEAILVMRAFLDDDLGLLAEIAPQLIVVHCRVFPGRIASRRRGWT